jgi:DNA-binding transcriptional LysR family regulator
MRGERRAAPGGAHGRARVGSVARQVLRNQDIALLPVLRALLSERSVTRAGERVGLSQPATSAALARLRRRFGDELLVRVGREYQLTPFASSLVERLEKATDALDRLFGDDFDPDTTTRAFSLVVSDYTVAMMSEDVNAGLVAESVGSLTIDLRHLTSADAFDTDVLLRQNDGVVLPLEAVRGYPGLPLIHDRWICIVDESNPAVADRVTREHLESLPMVTTHGRYDSLRYPPLREMRRLGIEPLVEVVTDSFLTVPFLVAGSRRIAFLQERLARRLAPVAPIRVLPSPIDIGELTLQLWWHPTLTEDPAHRWFRDLMSAGAQRLGQRRPSEASVHGSPPGRLT